ncbi:Cell division protein FtsL [Paenibacillus solanacearum]|uniref:Cell division protein FtsL n=1 Tax=Paenibacillus solanacearum TaxID=2048548 RepID=A0A916JXR9_9BACL|nr:cell division protein FtsL [Paenibacillus solanacearum]CAG7605648.1 Cell division protein FtsL [Paenibacillus solanacearum]
MPAYIHGSLAVEQRSENKVQAKEPKKSVNRNNKSLPVQEKLLYLFTVAICVVVAGLIIWRYAQIYEMNTNINKIEQKIKQLEAENSVLKHKVDALSSPERLGEEAKKLGLVVPDENQIKSAGSSKSVGSASSKPPAGNGPSGSAAAKKTKDQP